MDGHHMYMSEEYCLDTVGFTSRCVSMLIICLFVLSRNVSCVRHGLVWHLLSDEVIDGGVRARVIALRLIGQRGSMNVAFPCTGTAFPSPLQCAATCHPPNRLSSSTHFFGFLGGTAQSKNHTFCMRIARYSE